MGVILSPAEGWGTSLVPSVVLGVGLLLQLKTSCLEHVMA